MKTRGQIYSQEAAGLLRDISTYQALQKEQIFRLYPGKHHIIQNLLSYLLKQERIVYRDGLYFPTAGRPDTIDRGLLAAVWVLVDGPEQISELDLPNTCGYCTVAPNGEVQYYQKE